MMSDLFLSEMIEEVNLNIIVRVNGMVTFYHTHHTVTSAFHSYHSTYHLDT